MVQGYSHVGYFLNYRTQGYWHVGYSLRNPNQESKCFCHESQMSNFSETLANFNKATGRGKSTFSFMESETSDTGDSLLGSFRQRASESLSSFMETNPDKECLGLTTFQVYNVDVAIYWIFDDDGICHVVLFDFLLYTTHDTYRTR
jgi:hypothetical protein